MFSCITCFVEQLLSALHSEKSEEFRLQRFDSPVRKKRYKYPFIFQCVLVILIDQEIKVGLCKIFKT